jgi:3-oxoacyl-[acyl-carrier protein] reductase
MSSGPVALITGTRKGIGKHLAHHFAARGFRVVGCSREAPDWRVSGYEHVQADVADEAQVTALFAHVRRSLGRLDVLINNAGIASMNHLLLTPGATMERIMRTNFLGTAIVCREGAKLMTRAKAGRIVNFSTVAVPMQLEGEAIYAASKSAIETFTKILAREVGALGITVNAVGPTLVETDLIGSIPRAKIDATLDRLAIKRLATFEDVTNVVEFFIRPESGHVTGQVIYLGGA